MLTHWDMVKGMAVIKKPSILNVFKYTRWCRIYLIVAINWILIKFATVGGNGYAAMSSNNPFMMLTMNAMIDAISCITSDLLMSFVFGRKIGTIVSSAIAGSFYIMAGLLTANWPLSTIILLMLSRFFLTMAYNIQFLYSTEVCPTVVRCRAYAIMTSLGAIGALVSPQFIALQKFHQSLPLLSFGMATFIVAAISIFLPESKGRKMPQSLLDGELFGLNSMEKKRVLQRMACENPDLVTGNIIERRSIMANPMLERSESWLFTS